MAVGRGTRTQVAKWALAASVVAFAILLFGFGAAALVQAVGTADGWSVRADVGDSFGVVNAIVSGLALTALIITLRMQSRELAMQRAELAMQREALNQSRVELNRAAEANLRMLHVDLIRMAIDDQSLAAVWPPLVPGEPHEKERQYLYANLIYLHMWMGIRLGGYTDLQARYRLTYIFSSPIVRQ